MENGVTSSHVRSAARGWKCQPPEGGGKGYYCNGHEMLKCVML